MSTLNKLEQALAGAKGLAAQLKTFSLDTDNKDAKQMFDKLSQTADSIISDLEGRVQYVKGEELQYTQQQ